MICPACHRADLPAIPGQDVWRMPHPILVSHVVLLGLPTPCSNRAGRGLDGYPLPPTTPEQRDAIWADDSLWDL